MFQNTRRFDELRTYVGHRINSFYQLNEAIEALGEMELLIRTEAQANDHQILKAQFTLVVGINADDLLESGF